MGVLTWGKRPTLTVPRTLDSRNQSLLDSVESAGFHMVQRRVRIRPAITNPQHLGSVTRFPDAPVHVSSKGDARAR